MAEKPVITPAMMAEKPLVKIGHYVLGETLGVGTFGKVKSNLPNNKLCSFRSTY